MSEVSILLENCNCIKIGCIKIETNALNIKYGLNGVGKSTLSRAIYLKSNKNEEEIRNLLPYGAFPKIGASFLHATQESE